MDFNISELNSKIDSINLNNKKNTTGMIYARKNEPTYFKNMDLDEDDVVTFDEFKQYCKDNNADFYNAPDIQKNKITPEENESIYHRKNDENNNKITHNEYLDYCEQNAKIDIANKIKDDYFIKEIPDYDIKIEQEI